MIFSLIIKLLINFESHTIIENSKEDEDDDCVSGFNYELGNQNQKQKISYCMLGWQLKLGRSEEIGVLNYDKDVSHNHNPVTKI